MQNNRWGSVLAIGLIGGCAGLRGWAIPATGTDAKIDPVGYADTPPVFPGSRWKVHDVERPRPGAVRPAAEAGQPPTDAIVLFDGKGTGAFAGLRGGACPWAVDQGELVVRGRDIWTKESFADCQLHLEWRTDPQARGSSQKKGNSGIFFMDRYEIQILDCDNNPTYADGMAGAVYGQTPPLVNAVRPAGEWQSYDIVFTAPRLEHGQIIKPAYVTVLLNGIVVQNHVAILGPTRHREASNYEGDFPARAPLRLQDHGNSIPDRFRNVWLRTLN